MMRPAASWALIQATRWRARAYRRYRPAIICELVRLIMGSFDSMVHMSFSSLKLACPCLAMMTWSCTAMPNTWHALMIALVISTSAWDGVGSPDGWLWAITIALAPNSRARLTTSRG